MAKSKYTFAPRLRVLEVVVTEKDPNAVVLFELPKGLIYSIKAVVTDAFAAGATLAIGTPAGAGHLVAAQAIDATGLFTCTLVNHQHSTTQVIPVTATVSDKTAVGSVTLLIEFAVDKETKFQ